MMLLLMLLDTPLICRLFQRCCWRHTPFSPFRCHDADALFRHFRCCHFRHPLFIDVITPSPRHDADAIISPFHAISAAAEMIRIRLLFAMPIDYCRQATLISPPLRFSFFRFFSLMLCFFAAILILRRHAIADMSLR